MEIHKLLFFIGFFVIYHVSADDYRLINDIKVDGYKLNIMVEDNFNSTNEFTGRVVISFKSTTDQENFRLHSGINETTFASIIAADQESEDIITGDMNKTTDLLTFKYRLKANKMYTLTIDFNGTLRDDMEGFYKSTYSNGTTNYAVLSTQFEPVHARQAFPCFDEPSFKATFEITITCPANMKTVLGNTHGTSVIKGSQQIVTFEKTPKMSTYLIAFVISDFDCSGEDDFKVCSRSLQSSRDYAEKMAKPIINKYGELFGITYAEMGIKKMDQVAIPDFDAGAMENWGLVTYREGDILIDQNESSELAKQKVSTTIAHEFAHMWFGDLVTLHWWSDTFLNEGFAAFWEYHLLSIIKSEWQMDKQFVVDVLQAVFADDGEGTAVAISSEVSTPAEVAVKFNMITYNKGSSIIRMMQHVLGNDTFMEGLNKYLAAHKYAAAKPDDLWKALNQNLTDALNFTTFITPWIYQPGYPVVNVLDHGKDIILTQKRFLLSQGTTTNTTWFVPITFSTSHDEFNVTKPTLYLSSDLNSSLKIPFNGTGWVVVNNQQTGFYRVNYSEKLWYSILAGLKKNLTQIHEVNRAQIVDDILNLARIGEVKYKVALDVLSYLNKETEYVPWKAAINGLSFLLDRISGATVEYQVTRYMLELTKSLTLNGTDHISLLKKELGYNWLCKLDDIKTTVGAEVQFKAFKDKDIRIDNDLRSAVYCSALRTNLEDATENWEFLWNQFVITSAASERETIIAALGCTRNETLLKLYLNKTLPPGNGIRKQDGIAVMKAVLNGNAIGVGVVLDFLNARIDDLKSYFGGFSGLNSMVQLLGNKISLEKDYIKLKNLIKKVNGDFKTTLNNTLKSAHLNLKWSSDHLGEIKDYFNPPENDDDDDDNGATMTIRLSLLTTIMMTIAIIVL